MSKPARQLTRDDWLAAGLDALLNEGPDAVAVQPLARRLATTKGSFYWHFASRDELLRATLARWETVATDDVIAALEASAEPAAEKARSLFAQVTASSARHPGQVSLLAAPTHPDVAAAIERSTQRRIDYVATLLRRAGLRPAVAKRRAILAYATYLGHAQLVHTTPDVLPDTARARRALVDEMTAVLLV
jgi:AcrR family transcriptional regulator